MAFLKPGMTCCDIGANVGYYTLLFSVFAGDAGKVFAFEPLPSNLEFLRHHVLTNHCGNVQVLDFAITDYNGSATFEEHESRSMGHLSASGHLNVRCATLNELLADGAIATPDILKIDVEGAELSVLVGARETLQAAKPVIFLATHGNAAHSSCCRLLNDIGYDLEPIDGKPVEYSRELLAVAR
jgi:FkbM family methyltransferase